jgi:hypothetical protein
MNWIVASSDPRVTQSGYKTRAAAQKAADRSNAEAPEQHWHVEPDTFFTETEIAALCGGKKAARRLANGG